ncbi:MAG: serine hydrolase [Candidatus Magasanikbacteria bacterium]|nr:serine hydrolase [Candidatus Magasanikbacteria bacterium]
MKKLLTTILTLGILLPSSYVFAEAEFNPHFIISDEELQKCEEWSVRDIQSFLDSKGSYLANFRGEDVSGTIKTAAEIIYDSAIRNQISAKFLLVTLQKEQSLITDDAPSQKQMDWATGYAVCDSCSLSDPKVLKYKGFGKQVDGAAGIMRWYYDNRFTKSYIKQMNTETIIDSQPVTPQSWATAFLYTYTPHLHGNMNFWRIWSNWFTQFYPNGTIVQSPSSTEYFLIADGKKRRFKSMTSLITRADPKMAVSMSEADLRNYSDGPDIAFPNYSILKTSSATYLVDYDFIRPFASDEVVRMLGYNPQEIIEVSDNDLVGYVLGSTITASTTAPQGVVYQITDLGNSYYLLKDNILYPIVDADLIKTNFAGITVEKKTKKDITKYSTANEPLKFADGSLIKIKDTNRLYVIEKGKKRRISDEETFSAMGYKKENLVQIDLVYALAIPDGDQVYVNNALASSKSKFLGDNEAPVEDLFKTKVPAYLVAEYPSGKIISGKSIDQKRSIASLTKLLTTYEAVNQDFNIKKSITYSASKHSSYGNPLSLINGEKLNNIDILYSTLVSSVNNAARMLAEASGLSEKRLIEEIDKRLENWGADNTKITDVTGLDKNNESTPRDMLKIFVKVLGNNTIKTALSETEYTFKELLSKNKVATHNIKNTNQLMFNSKKPYRILASKTGFTDEAGSVLAMLIESKTSKKQYIILTMGNTDYTNRFVEPNRLAEWAISSASTASIAGVK